jgi:N-acetylmuramic acid 6-phosphate etherase
MDTEHVSPRYSDIDLWEPADVLHAMFEGQMAAVASVRAAIGAIERAASAIEQRLCAGGRLIYVGAGTSGRLAVQDGAELIPTFNWPPDRLLLLMAGGKDALLRSAENVEDEASQAVRTVKQNHFGPSDVVIAVAASGTTPFTLACLREAKKLGALTIGIANNRDTPILREADYPIWLDTGPEPIAGSTRMKAGTAQRVALNMLSSLVMIRLGGVHEGLMVNVQPTNAKLARRREQILRRLTSRNEQDVADALRRANGNVKAAVLLLHGCSPDEAANLLEQARGRLRTALQNMGARESAVHTGLQNDARDVPEELPSAVGHDD